MVAVLTLLAGAVAVHPVTGQVSEQAVRAFEGVGLVPRVGTSVPGEVAFLNAEGRAVTLGSLLGRDRPMVLTFAYHTCPMLCSALLEGVTRALSDIPWTPGTEYDLVTVSISPEDTPEIAKQQRMRYLERLGKAGATWHFLTGDEDAIRRVTQAVGFEYTWVEAQQEYAHPAAVIVLTGSGIVSRYLPDITPAARDLRAAMVEAGNNQLGTMTDRIFLYCFQYDPASNSYVMTATTAMRVGGLLTALVVVLGLCFLWLREWRARHITPQA